MLNRLSIFKTSKFVAILLFVSLLTVPYGSQTTPTAQAADSNTTTAGYDFSFSLPQMNDTYLVEPNAPEPARWVLYASSTSSGTITIDWSNSLQETTTVIANSVTSIEVNLADTQDGLPGAHWQWGGPFIGVSGNLGEISNQIHSTVPISLYGCFLTFAASDCTTFYPTSTWGTKYRPLYDKGSYLPEQLTILGGASPSRVTISFPFDLGTKEGDFLAGETYSFDLRAHEVWNNFTNGSGSNDFSGILITSTSPISVGNGAICTNFGETFARVNGACDAGFQIVPPISSWGSAFITTNYKNSAGGGSGYRILADKDNTVIQITGDSGSINHANISGGNPLDIIDPTNVVINAGEYYQFEAFQDDISLNKSLVINTSNPVLIGHYMGNGNYTSNGVSDTGDPSMNYVVPYQQFMSRYAFVSPPDLAVALANVVVPTISVSALTLDGLSVSSELFREIPGTSWSSAQLELTTGTHVFNSNVAFGMEAYGAGFYDSYAYTGGANTSNISAVRSLTISPSTFAGVVGQTVCVPITVKDAYGSPVVGVRVDATISGASGTLNSNSLADSFGIANICYVGTAVGADAISVSANSFTATAIVNWTSLAPVISYSPSSFDLDNIGAMPSIYPTNTGGAAVSWSSTPALPTGITLNTTTGVISGSPTTIQTLASYVITATNTSGSSTATIQISISAGTAPVISYSPATVVGLLDTPLTTISPITTGTWPTWSITPSLPSGVRFNAQNGQITGTPGAQSAVTAYTVTATNNTASAITTFTFSVQATPPVISFPTSSFTGTKNIPLNTIAPRNLGSPVATWSILPILPAGLNLNPANGSIFGTPTETSTVTSYTVTGTNSAGSSSASFTLTIAETLAAPSIAYSPSTLTALVGQAITTMLPTNSGGDASSWTITPALPAGLLFSSSIGTIYGTPTATSAATAYTVTAFNSTDSSTALVNIGVIQLLAPNITISPNVVHGHVATPLTTVQPTNTGGLPSLWTITPALPAGLSFNPINGSISGTPTAVSSATAYSVFAQNIVDSSTATVTIDITPFPAPVISYTASSLRLTTGSALSTLTPRNTGGAVATWGISATLPAGLSFNTSTGVISGTPTQASALTSYLITATNVGGTSTVSISIDVNNPVVSMPDPVQTSTITSSSSICTGTTASVVIKGSFVAKISKITINGVSLESSQWVQTQDSVTISLGSRPAGTLEVSIYNAQAPVLATQSVQYSGPCTPAVVTPTPIPTPTVTPTPVPTPTVTPVPTPTATPKPTVAPIPMENPSKGLKYIGSVYFAIGSSKLTLASQKTLRAIAAALKSSKTPQVLSLGNTDNKGEAKNNALSKARSAAVIAYLKKLNPEPVYVLRWYGSTRPVGKTNSAADLAKNRRVEVWRR